MSEVVPHLGLAVRGPAKIPASPGPAGAIPAPVGPIWTAPRARPGGSKTYEFMGFGAMDVTKPYKFIWFGDIHGPKPYKFIGFGDTGPGEATPRIQDVLRTATLGSLIIPPGRKSWINGV